MRVTMPTLVLDLESSSMCCNLPLVEWLLSQWGILKDFPQSKCIFFIAFSRQLMVSLAMSAASVRFSTYAENLFGMEDQGQSDTQSESLDICKNVSAFEGSVQCPWILYEEIRKLSSSSRSAQKELWQKKMENRWWEITNVDWGRAKIGWHSNHHSFQRKLVLKLALYSREKRSRFAKKALFKLGLHGKSNSCIQSFQQTFGFSMFLRSDLNHLSAPLLSWHARQSTQIFFLPLFPLFNF